MDSLRNFMIGGIAVIGGYLMNRGSYSAESFNATPAPYTCTTYTCRTEIGGTQKGSDAMRFLAFLNEIKNNVNGIPIRNIQYEDDMAKGDPFGTVTFKFDVCGYGGKQNITHLKGYLDGLRNGLILRGADYEDLHRPIQTLAEGDEPNENWYMEAETFNSYKVAPELSSYTKDELISSKAGPQGTATYDEMEYDPIAQDRLSAESYSDEVKARVFDNILEWHEQMQLQSESIEYELDRMRWMLENPDKGYDDYPYTYEGGYREGFEDDADFRRRVLGGGDLPEEFGVDVHEEER